MIIDSLNWEINPQDKKYIYESLPEKNWSKIYVAHISFPVLRLTWIPVAMIIIYLSSFNAHERYPINNIKSSLKDLTGITHTLKEDCQAYVFI